jgi:hypothetical protein
MFRRGSTSCVPRSRNCISCIPRRLLQVYQLGPELSTPSMTSCVPQLVRNFISCFQSCLLHAYLWCPDSSTANVRVAWKDMGIQNVQQFEVSYKVLWSVYFIGNYMHIHRIVEWYRQRTVVMSWYRLMLKPYWKKNLFWEDGRHIILLISPISSYCYDLVEIIFSGKCFNAVSLGVPSTWLLNCFHIILIHSAESSVWYFTNLLLFHVQKLFNWFSKYIWYLVAHICVNSCFHPWNEKRSSKYQNEQIPILTVARTQTLNLNLIN